MYRTLLLLFLLLPICSALFGQNKTEDFELAPPEQKVQNSLYNTITVLDGRKDSTNMGIVQLGAFNRKARVIPKIPFPKQLKDLLDSLTEPATGNEHLLLQLRRFSFAEVTASMSERGYFYFRANLYSDSNGQYRTIATIDTVLIIKSMDVTKPMLRRGGKLLTAFIADNLVKRSTDPVYYSMHDLIGIDSIEKGGIKLYNTTTYPDGLYKTYTAFKNLSPDKPIMAQVKDGKIEKTRTTDSTGKSIKVKPGTVYALVFQGQPYASTEYGFYPLEKRGSDFFFIGQAKASPNSADVMAASLMFGVIGGLLASNVEGTFEMQIDHVNGGFLHIRQINMPPDNY